MSDNISNPLLALIKERNLIDDLQLEEVLQEQARSGKSVMQILHDFELVDMDSQLQVIAEHLGTEVVSLSDRNLTGSDPLRLAERNPFPQERGKRLQRLILASPVEIGQISNDVAVERESVGPNVLEAIDAIGAEPWLIVERLRPGATKVVAVDRSLGHEHLRDTTHRVGARAGFALDRQRVDPWFGRFR